MPRPSKGARLVFNDQRGLWYIRDGDVKRGTGADRAHRLDAEQALARYIAEKAASVREADGPVRSIEHVGVAEVLRYYADTRFKDLASDAQALSIKALAPFWADRKLADVRASTCAAYVAWRTAQPVRNAPKRRVQSSTARRELGVLNAAIQAYHAEFPLPSVPTVTLPPAAPPRERWLRREEVAGLLRGRRAVRYKDEREALKRFIMIGVYTGTRSGAIKGLRWDRSPDGGWIDLERGVIHRAAEGEQQTKKRKPPVKIPSRLMPFLRRWKAADGRSFGPVIHIGGDPVVDLGKSWAAARAFAGLDSDVVPHIMRHTTCTWLAQAGADANDAANFVGMSLQMYTNVYGHHHPDFQTDVADAASRGGRR
jgi:integrase